MASTHPQDSPGLCPVESGSVSDRLSQWCAKDCLQQEDSVREALALCEEALHALPDAVSPGDQALFEVGAVATLVCAVQSGINGSTQCTS